MDKPVILTSFDGDKNLYYWKSARRLVDYPHQKKFVEMGGAEVVHSYEKLEESILRYLENPNFRIAERTNALENECFSKDGKSTDRVIVAMQEIVEKIEVVYAKR